MSLLVLAGPRFNLIENATAITPSTAADALFPTTALADRIPASIFKFGSITTAPSIIYDIEAMGGTGGFESWSGGAPVGWTEADSGSGTVTEVVGGPGVFEGTRAAQFDCSAGGAATASIYKDVTVRTGQKFTIMSALAGDALGGDDMILRIRNLDTGSYLTAAGAWQSSTAFVHPTTPALGGGAYESWSTAFQVESYATVRKATTTLRVQLANEVTGRLTYADAVYLIPAVTFSSIHGHNIDPRCTLVLRSSSDSSSWTTRATFTVRQPSFYATCAVQYYRYWQHLFTETNYTGAIYFGEAVLGEYLSVATGPRLPMSVTYTDTQIRVPMRWGSQVYGLGQAQQRTFPFSMRATSMANRQEIFDEVFRRSQGGHPLVMVPHDANSHTDVIYGRLTSELPHEWEKHDIANLSGTIEELPFPFVTS